MRAIVASTNCVGAVWWVWIVTVDSGLGRARINLNARIVLCGSISKSDAATPQPGPASYSNPVWTLRVSPIRIGLDTARQLRTPTHDANHVELPKPQVAATASGSACAACRAIARASASVSMVRRACAGSAVGKSRRN
jgi:hypothetical protein